MPEQIIEQVAGAKSRSTKPKAKAAPKQSRASSKSKSLAEKGAAGTKKTSKKSGGAFMDDVKSLAVPFAILLAKQGLENMMDKKKGATAAATTSSTPKKATTAKPSSVRRRSTAMSGGSGCSACSATASVPVGMSGGATANNSKKIKDSFSKIAADIDKFLAKY